MKKGDLAFFYHSSCKVPAIVGTMEIVEEHTPDRQFPPLPPSFFLISDSLPYSNRPRPLSTLLRRVLQTLGPQMVRRPRDI